MTANPNLKTQTYSEFHQTPVITVDEFVRKENMLEGLDVVKIDTEGNDAAVLIGASKTLMSLKPFYVQFEKSRSWEVEDIRFKGFNRYVRRDGVRVLLEHKQR